MLQKNKITFIYHAMIYSTYRTHIFLTFSCFLMQNSRSYGFTLLELLIVIVIIGMLAAYVGPKYFAQLGKSEVTVARSQIDAFEKALDTFRLDIGRYPTSEEGLNALSLKPTNISHWAGPYLKKQVPLDPWGNAYVYRSPGQAKDFDIISYGKDGQSGGEGEASDISN